MYVVEHRVVTGTEYRVEYVKASSLGVRTRYFSSEAAAEGWAEMIRANGGAAAVEGHLHGLRS